MSGNDHDLGHDHIDDAEFEAFLQGGDPLARDLAALEQPAPPPALDAAIQARIAAALAAERLAELPAANDPVAGGAVRSWQSRWQLPLALAAGVTAISIALPLWQVHDPVSEATVAAAPAPRPVPVAADAAPAPAPKAEPELRVAPQASAGKTPAKIDLENRKKMAKAGKQVQPKLQDEMQLDWREGTRLAREAAPIAAKSARSDMAINYYMLPSPAPAPAPFLPPPQVQAQSQPPLAAPALAPPPPAAAIPGLRVATEATGETHAKAWLLKIEDLLKQNERPEALAEWRKFRAIYPDYPVPEKLAANFPPAKD